MVVQKYDTRHTNCVSKGEFTALQVGGGELGRVGVKEGLG